MPIPLTLDALLSELTYEQVRDSTYGILTTLGFPVTSWRVGGVARTIVALLGKTVAPLTTIQVAIAKSGFLDWATGDYLTILAKQVYNVTRNPATSASGFVTLNNAGGGVYTFAAYAFRVLNPATGKLYQNTAGFPLGALQTGLQVPFAAVEPGAASTTAAATITALANPIANVTCTNALEFDGSDGDTDDQLRTRCRAKLGALSPMGPKAAYDYVARSSDINGGVSVTRTKILADSPTGHVTVYVANDLGALPGGDVSKVANAINLYAAPLCFTPSVNSANAVPITVTCTVYVYTSQNLVSADVQAAVANALASYFKTIPIGGFIIPPATSGSVLTRAIIGEIKKAAPVFQVDLALPAADVPLLINEVAILAAPNVTVQFVTP